MPPTPPPKKAVRILFIATKIFSAIVVPLGIDPTQPHLKNYSFHSDLFEE
jgi:hypothetical protein